MGMGSELHAQETEAEKYAAKSVIRGIKTNGPDDPSTHFPARYAKQKCRFVVQLIRGKTYSDSLHKVDKTTFTTLKHGSMSIYANKGLFATGVAKAYNGEYDKDVLNGEILTSTLEVKFANPRAVIASASYKVIHITTNTYHCKGTAIVSAALQPQFTVNRNVSSN